MKGFWPGALAITGCQSKAVRAILAMAADFDARQFATSKGALVVTSRRRRHVRMLSS